MNKLSILSKKIEILKAIQQSNNRVDKLVKEQEENPEVIEKTFEKNSGSTAIGRTNIK